MKKLIKWAKIQEVSLAVAIIAIVFVAGMNLYLYEITGESRHHYWAYAVIIFLGGFAYFSNVMSKRFQEQSEEFLEQTGRTLEMVKEQRKIIEMYEAGIAPEDIQGVDDDA